MKMLEGVLKLPCLRCLVVPEGVYYNNHCSNKRQTLTGYENGAGGIWKLGKAGG